MSTAGDDKIQKLEKRIEKLESLLEANFGLSVTKQPKDAQSSEKRASQETLESTPQVDDKLTDEKSFESKTNKTLQAPMSSENRLEAQIGGRLLNIFGIIALVIGVAFFIGYAFQNNWIGPTGRIALGYLAALILLFYGEFLKVKYAKYSQGLTGGGLAVLYISTYSAFSMYHLIPVSIAYILMVVTTVSAVFFAVRYNSRVIAYIGLIGGFLTPLIITTNQALTIKEHLSFFIYLTILNLGIVSISYFKRWKDLILNTFFITLMFEIGWMVTNYQDKYFILAFIFTIVIYLIYLTVPLAPKISRIEKYISIIDVVIFLINPLSFLLVFLSLFDWNRLDGAFFSLIMGSLYMAVAIFLNKFEVKLKSTYMLLLGIALSFITVAIPFLFELSWLTVAWAVEAVILIYIGIVNKNTYFKTLGLILLGFVGLRTISNNQFLYFLGYINDAKPSESAVAFFNKTSVMFITIISAYYFVAYFYFKLKEKTSDDEKAFIVLGVIGANILTVWWLSQQTVLFFQQTPIVKAGSLFSSSVLSLSMIWGFYSAMLIATGIKTKASLSRYMGLVLLGITVFKLFFVDLSGLETVYRIVSFIVLGLLMLGLSFAYQKYKDLIF